MSRIFFAAARGARIEDDGLGHWSDSYWLHLIKGTYRYRIHPEDAHLQYGPVSTALRKLATTGKEPKGLAGRLAIRAAAYEWEGATDTVLFYLFLAEFLADEGM